MKETLFSPDNSVRQIREGGITRPMHQWQNRAACADLDPDVFFPSKREVSGVESSEASAALEICRGCPVKVHCLEAALKEEKCEKARYGIRGGVTPAQRYRLYRRRRDLSRRALELQPALSEAFSTEITSAGR